MTAEPAAATAQVTLETDPRLREVDFGEAEGITPEELAETFPEAERIFRATPASNGLPGGEDGAHAIARFTGALAEIVATAGPDDNVLIVAHGTVIRLVLASLLGIDPNDYRRRFVNPGNDAVTSVRFDPSVGLSSAMLLRFNERI
jgi:probable phosphoglycerate mutase